MPDPEPRPRPSQPDEKPTPNRPKDPAVYGGQWGEGEKHPGGPSPPDRPDRIKPPAESE
jgi:hypothetical protein